MKINSPQFNLMQRACMKAAKTLIRDFGEVEKLQVSEKGPGDFVTASDKRVEKIIIKELSNSDYSFLTEEQGRIEGKIKDRRWIIDPIDGTTNFLNGLPHFAISIAFEEKGEIISGIIFDPIKNEIFSAHKGMGAYLNNTRIRVSKKSEFKNAFLVTGGPRFVSKKRDDIFEEFKKISNIIKPPIRKSGSAALDLCLVAEGKLDAFWEVGLSPWDVAAPSLICKQVGLFIGTYDGDYFDAFAKDSLLVTPHNLKKEFITYLSG